MKVSIVVPVYNVEPYIEECIRSVMKQSYQGPIECILVDDCGQDKSIEIASNLVDNYQGPIVFSIVHHETNLGLSEARNTGLKVAQGDYVYFLDSDDTISFDCIESLALPLEKQPYDFVIADFKYICDWDQNLSAPFFPTDMEVIGREAIIKTYRRKWNVHAWNKLLNRSFLIKNNLFFKPQLLHEDELWSFQLACVASSMYVVKKQTYFYLLRGGSIMSAQKTKRNFESLIQVIKGQVEVLRTCQLEKNIYLYDIIEEGKRWRMADALEQFPLESFSVYKELRALNHSFYFAFVIHLHLFFRACIRDFHYLLPQKLGYRYVCALNGLFTPGK